MVHVSPDNKIFVVGALYKFGHRPDRFLSQVIIITPKTLFQFNIF